MDSVELSEPAGTVEIVTGLEGSSSVPLDVQSPSVRSGEVNALDDDELLDWFVGESASVKNPADGVRGGGVRREGGLWRRFVGWVRR